MSTAGRNNFNNSWIGVWFIRKGNLFWHYILYQHMLKKKFMFLFGRSFSTPMTFRRKWQCFLVNKKTGVWQDLALKIITESVKPLQCIEVSSIMREELVEWESQLGRKFLLWLEKEDPDRLGWLRKIKSPDLYSWILITKKKWRCGTSKEGDHDSKSPLKLIDRITKSHFCL